MAESSLSLGFPELQQRVGHFLGYGSVIADWSTAQDAEIILLVQSGIRRVYYAPSDGYEWSWLRPTNTLYLGASGTDGTVTGTSFDSATFTDWVAQGVTTDDTVDITAVGSGSTVVADYVISSVATGAITLSSSPGNGTSLTFRVKRTPANFDLPDDFGRLIGDLYFETDDVRDSIAIVPIGDLLQMRVRRDENDWPRYAAIRPKSSTGSTGQRQEILFWPKPSVYHVLTYNYEAYSGELTDALPYPLGGMQFSELYIESCLSVAEQRNNDEAGLHTQAYGVLLADAIARDRKHGARYFGQMGGGERDYAWDSDRGVWRRGYTGGTYPVTYGGNLL